MKITLKVVLIVLVAAFYSCGKDEVSSASSSITSAGVISGTISNYGVSPVDSIHFNRTTAIVSTVGKFSSTLAIPASSDLHKFEAATGMEINDINALVCEPINIVAFHNGRGGVLLKTNASENMTSLDGTSFSVFVYCDRDVALKGSVNGGMDNVGGLDISGMMTYDVKLKKGWNEMILTIEKLSMITGEATIKLSSTIPSDLKWITITVDAAGTASKVRMFKSLLKK